MASACDRGLVRGLAPGGYFMHIFARTLALAGLFAAVGCGNSHPELQTNYDDLSFTQKPQITIVSPAQGGHVATTKDGFVDVVGTSRGSALLVNGQAVAVDKAG